MWRRSVSGPSIGIRGSHVERDEEHAEFCRGLGEFEFRVGFRHDPAADLGPQRVAVVVEFGETDADLPLSATVVVAPAGGPGIEAAMVDAMEATGVIELPGRWSTNSPAASGSASGWPWCWCRKPL